MLATWLLFWVLANKSSNGPDPAGVASIDPVIPLPPLPEVDADIILCSQQTEVVVGLPLGPAGVAPPAAVTPPPEVLMLLPPSYPRSVGGQLRHEPVGFPATTGVYSPSMQYLDPLVGYIV